MSERLTATADATLLAFLRARLPQWSRRKLKARLKNGYVTVNDKAVSGHAHPLVAGDVVTVGAATRRTQDTKGPGAGIEVRYSDDVIVAIDKPAGLLSVSTDRETERTALALVRRWLGPRERLWPVNRIDRETSGLLLFARSREIRDTIQARWSEDTEKTYLAIVDGIPESNDGLIDQPLSGDVHLNVRVARTADAKRARTRYRVVEECGQRALLKVQLETGRRHQIRVHLAWLGHSIVGDPRYGTTSAPRLGLHALRLRLRHPVTGAGLEFEAPPPDGFNALLRGRTGRRARGR